MNQRKLSQHSSVGTHPDRSSRPALPAGSTGRAEEPSDGMEGGFSSILRKYPLVLAVTALAALLCTTVAAFAVYQAPDPVAWIQPASCLSLALASLVGGILAGWQNRPHSVGASLLCGGATAVLLTILSLVLPGESGLVAWVMGLGVVLLHLIGGLLTRPRSHKTTHTAGKHPSHRR